MLKTERLTQENLEIVPNLNNYSQQKVLGIGREDRMKMVLYDEVADFFEYSEVLGTYLCKGQLNLV